MKLALRFTIAFVASVCLVWGIASYLRIQREINLFESDIRRDHAAIGSDLSLAVTTLWRMAGENSVREIIDEANASKSHIEIRWVSPEYSADSAPTFSAAFSNIRDRLPEGKPIFTEMRSSTGTWLYTFIPVTIDGTQWGAIEMSESLADKDRYIRATIWRTAMWTGILAAVTAALSMILGLLFVGRPVHRLIKKARDVAQGNLRERVEISQNDELGELAAELNAMSDRLAEAYHRIDQEESAHQMTLEQLRHADRLVTVGKLASAIAHELGTPLNVILARARMAQTGEVSGEGLRENNAAIMHQANRMVEIIRQLLNFARRREPRMETIDLNHIIQQSVSILSPLARRRNVVIDFKSPGAPLDVTVDPEQIQQVLLNIIVNGIEAMPRGGQLTISAEIYENVVTGHSGDAKTPFIRIRIRDSGEGIAPENISRLFDPFFTTKGREEGTGLGLSISSNIVREHGGWIDVQSEIDKGTMFVIYLPKESKA